MMETLSLYLTWAWFGTGSWHQNRRTDRITIAYTRLAVPAVARKTNSTTLLGHLLASWFTTQLTQALTTGDVYH